MEQPGQDSISEDIDWDAPPPYELEFKNEYLDASTAVLDNGRINMQFVGHDSLPPCPSPEPVHDKVPQHTVELYPRLNIVIQIVGSRGDVQPFIALGNELQIAGHRVRIATHDVFRTFVQESGLEFYPIGGDPAELMAYMVRNPGILPSIETMFSGEIANKRKMICKMLEGCWNSCIEPDPVTNAPFVAEAIIANPPSFAHVHCAQALGIPVHLMFTMPWTATRSFPHPLSNIQAAETDSSTANFLSYGLVDIMTWQGLGNVINHWRKKTLDLEPVPVMAGPHLMSSLDIPMTYCWSPALVPKPADWPSHIDVCGFFFRPPPPYDPNPRILGFLEAGSSPIYIGFGSIVMDDSAKMTATIIEAVQHCGVRAIVSKGWSKLGQDVEHPNILFIDDCPHEWLFKHVSAVIHHGGAGTTACGLLNGRPTTIVPFFGDQPFWGNMVAAAGAGPFPIDHKSLDVPTLVSAIQFCLSPNTLKAAQILADRMRHENGVKQAVNSFHRNLPIKDISCDLMPDHPATWYWKKGKKHLKLSHQAASSLVENKKIDVSDLTIYKSKPIQIKNRRWDPVTASTSAALGSLVDVGFSMGNIVGKSRKEYRGMRSKPREDGTSHSGLQAGSIAMGKGLGGVGMALTKTAVDLPLAFTEGFHNIPTWYGDKVRDHGPVNDWKSGGVVGLKNLGYGMADGYIGLFKQPIEGAIKEGGKGFAKGLGKGTVGFLTKPASAIFGLVSYPALGLYRSLSAATYHGAQGKIILAQKNYGECLAMTQPLEKKAIHTLMEDFERQVSGR